MTNNKYSDRVLEKHAVLESLGVAGLAHLAQNQLTRLGIKSQRFGRSVANSFQEGVANVHDSSLGSKLKSTARSVFSPDLEVMKQKARDLGSSISPDLSKLNPRHRAGLRMLSEGRFQKFNQLKGRMGINPLHEGVMDRVVSTASKNLTGVGMSLRDLNPDKLSELWKSKQYPLLSNITKNLSRGSLPAKSAPGAGDASGLKRLGIGGVLPSVLEPVAGSINAAKLSTMSPTLRKNKYAAKAMDFVEKHLIRDPIKHGYEKDTAPTALERVKSVAYEHLISPMSAHLNRTSRAIRGTKE